MLKIAFKREFTESYLVSLVIKSTTFLSQKHLSELIFSCSLKGLTDGGIINLTPKEKFTEKVVPSTTPMENPAFRGIYSICTIF